MPLCPCTDGTADFTCTKCFHKPGRSQISKLAAIYAMERLTWVNKLASHQEYVTSVMFHHIEKIKYFSEEELDNDMRTHLRLSLDEWYNSL